MALLHHLRGLVLLIAATASSPISAASISSRQDGATAAPTTDDNMFPPHDNGCVHMPIWHSDDEARFGKRAFTASLKQRFDVAYYTRLSFGTPPQEALLHLDTGSFELWVNPTCSVLDPGQQKFCNQAGFFDTTQSSTVQRLGTSKILQYGIGSANISYVRDNIGVPGTNMSIRSAQFGVATSSETQAAGILGIGHGDGQTIGYRNFIDELVAQNLTKTKAFSVALGGKDEKTGVVVFGGVDTSKFAGRLAKLPITPAAMSPDLVRRYWVQMDGISLSPPNGMPTKAYNNTRMQVFLDTGSTLTLLPEPIIKAIAADFGSVAQDTNGYWPVSCSLVSLNGTVDFSFPGVTVRVPYREMIRQAGDMCVLGLAASPSFTLLGDTFLRAAYVVFDQDSDAIWMTQYTNCGSTPAALQTAASLATLTGVCTSTAASVDLSAGNNGGGATSNSGGGGGAATPVGTGSGSSAGGGGGAATSAPAAATGAAAGSRRRPDAGGVLLMMVAAVATVCAVVLA